MQTKQHHRLLALLMTVVMFFQITVMSPFAAFAEDTDTSVVLGNEEQQINTETGKEEEPSLRAASGTTTVLTFTSDIHNQSNNTAANRLDGWLDFVKETYGGVDVMSFCGDMGSASGSGDSWWSYVTSVKAVVDEQNIPGVYTTGNHEFYNGSFSSTTNAMKSNYKVGAEGISGDNFRIYCLGTDNWNNNQDNYTTGQVSTLTNYLNSVDDSKPIIVLTHFPLHHYSSRTTTNADLVINALNTAANSGKKIVLLWGHNHTMLDTNYDEIFEPGSVVEYASGKTATFNFYYAAAGCMSDSEYGNGSAYVKGKGLVITINNKNQLSFTYYDANRNNVTEGGTYTEQDPVPIESAVIDEAITKDENGQPVIVVPTLEVGRTLQLHITTDPEDATQKSVTWESSNTSVATVDANGKVKGIAAGTSTITVTVSDGITRGTATASVDIEILPRSSSGPMYVLTDTFEAGKNYIIANKNDGTAYALTNNNGSVAVTAVEVEGDTIYLDEEV